MVCRALFFTSSDGILRCVGLMKGITVIPSLALVSIERLIAIRTLKVFVRAILRGKCQCSMKALDMVSSLLSALKHGLICQNYSMYNNYVVFVISSCHGMKLQWKFVKGSHWLCKNQ